MHFLLAFNPLEPIANALTDVLRILNGMTHSLGWTLVIFAALVKLVLWPLSQMQFKSMAEMQRVAPQIKKLQAQYKGDPQKMNQEVMALYKEHGVNPMAGCLPLLIQLPILFSLYSAINSEHEQFAREGWLWIGSSLSHAYPQILGTSLAAPDMVLLALYVVSMYFSVRYGTAPATDPAQAQQQKIMAFVSPVIIAWVGRSWYSALILYWFFFNAFSMLQSFYLLRKYGMIKAAPAAEAEAKAIAADKAPREASAARGNGKTGANAPRKKRSRR
ncbi:MAG: membrane protein insertase YidC [Candidatus Eremiobacteraeota bacterium]|nr:membrane protein insertase YidC [Candidatus Eremiobacteraeota bacterium]